MRNILLRNIGIASLFTVLIFTAFGHALWQGFSPVDDGFLIVNNLAIRGFTFENLKTVFTTYDPELYIPFVFVSYQIDYILGGLHPPTMLHLTNILLHIANSLLVARILFQLTNKKILSIFAALVFAVHPLNTEAVVWLAGRKDSLSAFFFFLSFTFYLQKSYPKRTYIFSLLFFLCALFSKVTAVTLLGVIALHMLLIKRRKIDWKFVRFLSPYAILAVIFMVIALGGKGRVIDATTHMDKVLVATKSSVFYLQKLIAPVNLTTIYSMEGDILLFSARIFPSFLFAMLLLWLGISSLRKRPWLSFAVFWYIGVLSPTFFNIGKGGAVFFAVDRYAYMPSLAVLFVFVVVASALQERLKLSKPIRYSSAAVVLGILTVLSIQQTKLWDGPTALFERSIELFPSNVGARVGLSTVYRQQGKLAEAFEVLREGLAYTDHVRLHMGAAVIYAKTGRIADAEEQLNIASELDPEHPEPVFELGNLYLQTGRRDLAVSEFKKAVELDDSYVVARSYLGMAYLEDGEFDAAREQFETSLEWNMSSPEANWGMVKLLEAEENLEAARPYLKRVLDLNPAHQEANKLAATLGMEHL